VVRDEDPVSAIDPFLHYAKLHDVAIAVPLPHRHNMGCVREVIGQPQKAVLGARARDEQLRMEMPQPHKTAAGLYEFPRE
jgi:hypothetical protein